jgi:hypothetical protein
MKLRNAMIILFILLLIGWSATLNAYDLLDKSSIGALQKIITLLQEIKAIDQQTADNTRAIRDRIGAKR